VQAVNPDAKPWHDFVVKIREWARINNPAMYAYIHPRTSIDGAELLKGGHFTVEEAVDMTLFKGSFDDTAKKAALTACPLPVVKVSVPVADPNFIYQAPVKKGKKAPMVPMQNIPVPAWPGGVNLKPGSLVQDQAPAVSAEAINKLVASLATK
jgi:hypothetical protein